MCIKYYKDKNGNPHQGPIPEPHLSKLLSDGGSEISYDEFIAIQSAKNTPTNEQKCCYIRDTRNKYLLQCDMVTNRHRDQVDASLPTTITNAQYLEVLALKQTLRDIPQQTGFPDNVVWPSVPNFLE